jgi:predicted SprT family Zn-dependent metalloprotease
MAPPANLNGLNASGRNNGPTDLVAAFNMLNERYFAGKLQAELAWSSRMRVIAGNCDWRRGIIRLSHPYHQQHPHELEATLLHEMLHLALRRGHDTVFRQAAAKVGAPMRASGQAQHRPYKYVYVCPGCGVRIKRRRKGVWACAACGGGVYNPRYRLHIVEIL